MALCSKIPRKGFESLSPPYRVADYYDLPLTNNVFFKNYSDVILVV